MTESEAQKWLERFEWDDNEETSEALTTICEALQEVQEYKTIGTIEELKSMKENGAFTGVELAQLAAMQMRLKEYLAIGTIEEFKALKEKAEPKKVALRLCGDCQRGCVDCDRYEDRCPACNGGLYVESGKNHEYCPNCGQKLDWSE